jgi:hypothetical protein
LFVRLSLIALSLLCICELRPLHAAAPLEACGRLPSLEDVALSPAEKAELTEPIEDPCTHRMIGGARVDDDTFLQTNNPPD